MTSKWTTGYRMICLSFRRAALVRDQSIADGWKDLWVVRLPGRSGFEGAGVGRHVDGVLRAARRAARSSRARSWVEASTTRAAAPSSWARSQLAAVTHQRSPGTRPGKRYCGIGVLRSLPMLALVLEELRGHHRADRVAAEVLGAGAAAAVAVEAGDRDRCRTARARRPARCDRPLRKYPRPVPILHTVVARHPYRSPGPMS